MSDADCTPGREPRSVAASCIGKFVLFLFIYCMLPFRWMLEHGLRTSPGGTEKFFTSRMRTMPTPVFLNLGLLGRDFEVFAPQGRLFAPTVVHLCRAWGLLGQLAPKTKFYEFSEYKRRTAAYPLRDFYKIISVCGQFDSGLITWILRDSLKEFGSYGGLNFRCVFPKFSAPLAAKLYIGCKNIFQMQEWHRSPVLEPTLPNMVGWDFAPRPQPGEGAKKFDVFIFIRYTFKR